MNASQWSDLPLVLTSEQAAAVLQLTRRTITNMLDRGDLRGAKIGKEWRISRAELLRFVEGDALLVRARALAADDVEPSLANKGGVLVIQAEPLENLVEFISGERVRRVEELIRQAGL
jgi:excisionase family DNA binding protein